MEFLKKHYEKVILGVVLLGLAAVAAWLPIKISSENELIRQQVRNTLPNVEPLDPVEVGEIESTGEKLEDPPEAKFTEGHNLFNPVKWIRMPDGRLIKLSSPEQETVERLQITDIRPLKLLIEYDRPSGSGFYFAVTQEASDNPADRRRRTQYVSRDRNNDVFSLVNVQGPQNDPVAFDIELNDSKKVVTLSESKPFERIEGYAADLRDPIEDKTWENMREDGRIILGGDTNIIVAISSNEVVFRAVSNEKNTTLKLNPVPGQ